MFDCGRDSVDRCIEDTNIVRPQVMEQVSVFDFVLNLDGIRSYGKAVFIPDLASY